MPEGQGFTPKEASMPQPTPLHSWYFEKATNAVLESGRPETQALLAEAIEKIDTAAVDNLSVYRSKAFEGTAFPVTSIPLDYLYGGKIPRPGNVQRESNVDHSPKKHVIVVFPGIALGPDTASPYTAGDIVIDDALRALNRTVQPVTEVVSLGSPLSPGGEISSSWVGEAQKSALDANGKLYAEYFLERYGNDPNVVFEFHGMSYGGGLAITTAAKLEQSELFKEKGRVRLLIDNPAGYHRPGESKTAGIQTTVGFIGEGAVMMVKSALDKSHVTLHGEKEFYQGYKKLLKQRGYKSEYSPEEEKIRQEARNIHMKQLLKGSEYDDTSAPTYIRKGLGDPTRFRPENISHMVKSRNQDSLVYPLGKEGASHEYAIDSGHFINRYRVDRWHMIAADLLNLPRSLKQEPPAQEVTK